MTRHLLSMAELSPADIKEIVSIAYNLKYNAPKYIPVLANKSIGLIFDKVSTRTRISMELAVVQLGGHATTLNNRDTQLSRGEPIKDSARVMSGYFDGVMIRTFGHNIIEEFAKYGSIPVINGLTDLEHPLQVLADMLSVYEKYKKLAGIKLTYIGDPNNMLNSLAVGGLKVGMNIAYASPEKYPMDADYVAISQELAAANKLSFEHSTDPLKASKNSDVVYTDVWASMGQEDEAEARARDYADYQINKGVIDVCHPDPLVLHCLPAHRGEEITDEVMESHADEIFNQAHNRLHAQKAVLVWLFADREKYKDLFKSLPI